jgi:hypothetical protein
MDINLGPYEPCPCGSGKKYKFCCAAAARKNRHGKFPMGTVIPYGPDDEITTKIVAGVQLSEDADMILERFVGTGVKDDPSVREQILRFFARHGVKNVVVSNGNMGCPHEEGIDFPVGTHCPFCPFWRGKQGLAADDEVIEPDAPAIGDEMDDDDDDDQLDADASFKRVEDLLRDIDDWDEQRRVMCEHVKCSITFPCLVTGTEDFHWEEFYVIGPGDPKEYRKLRRTQPSYQDTYELIGVDPDVDPKWAIRHDDVAAYVIRKSDGKPFTLGLSEIEPVDKTSPAAQILDEFAVWFWNWR